MLVMYRRHQGTAHFCVICTAYTSDSFQNAVKPHACLPESFTSGSDLVIFIPCSRFTRKDLLRILNEMEEVSTISPDLSLQYYVFDPQILAESESRASILRIPVEKLMIEEFRLFLSRRLPLVITGLNSSLCLSWSPSQLIGDYGKEPCMIEDCEA
jgi:hypothetical protein